MTAPALSAHHLPPTARVARDAVPQAHEAGQESAGPAAVVAEAGDRAALPQRIRFAHNGAFHRELKKRVDEYFEATGYARRDLPRMVLKAAVIFAWFTATWVTLVFFTTSWWAALPLSVLMGLAVSGVGMGVQHDANHGATSRSGRINRVLGWSMDVVGASSHVWRTKHNTVHHTFTNVAGQDDDIDLGPLGRLAPGLPRRPMHRFQHIYMWVLYGLMLPKWVFYDDISSLRAGKLGVHELARPTGTALYALLAGKLAFVSWSLLIPALFHPLWVVLICFFITNFTVGLVLAVTFQLAHCVQEADFPMPGGPDGRMADDWAVHQLATTVDFSRHNPILTWYMGGLNFQAVHHLFPKTCHLHYPALSRILEVTSEKHGLRYRVHDSFWSGIRSHYRLLKQLGQTD